MVLSVSVVTHHLTLLIITDILPRLRISDVVKGIFKPKLGVGFSYCSLTLQIRLASHVNDGDAGGAGGGGGVL